MAALLNVSYVHRVAKYGSLSTVSDRFAVERLFGWADLSLTRSSFLRQFCEDSYLTESEDCGIEFGGSPKCGKLKKNTGFKRIVQIPRFEGECLRSKEMKRSECKDRIRRFGKTFGEDGTIFELTPGMCQGEYREGDFKMTGDWLPKKYWDFHEGQTSRKGGIAVTRVLNFDENIVEVAVHVRRGDFFQYSERKLIADEVYAEVIMGVRRAASKVFGDVRVRANVYSEGKVKEGVRTKNNHDVKEMDNVYLDVNGSERGDGYKFWKNMVDERGGGVDIRMNVAAGTIQSLHEMFCADVFIGSVSGMSMQTVSTIGRGVLLLPGKVMKEGKKEERLRLTYNHDNGDAPEMALMEGLKESAGKMEAGVWKLRKVNPT